MGVGGSFSEQILVTLVVGQGFFSGQCGLCFLQKGERPIKGSSEQALHNQIWNVWSGNLKQDSCSGNSH